MPRLLAWLDERRPDVVCLQETKLADDAFAELSARSWPLGLRRAAHGEPPWNGVAILSRVGLDDVVAGIPGGPGFPHQEARAVSATCGGIRVTSVYVPNGREPDSEHYHYKLAWLAALREMVAADPEASRRLRRHEHRPDRRRRLRPRRLLGQTHVTAPERAALAELQAARPARRRPRPLAGPQAAVHLLGLPRRHVPPGPRDADRPHPGGRAESPTACRRHGSTATRARARAERSRAGDRRSRRGARRRHRAGRAAAVRSAGQARREAAAAGPVRLRPAPRSRCGYCLRSRSRDGCTRLGSPGIFG